ncbi:amphi-Trp domain-containing protein [Desulfonatronospira sp. MSAO_Bac3]|uniref:amphi-Trp domain-containing protein n=1 Tax=Desulfonatronospira sp. MSAO_Bac3 TaxID=2293857 RepID=UPI00257F7ED6|nr:amphi-Trp domain-containing protein [Desulfonatronospira sp. MSAO_Bac3]
MSKNELKYKAVLGKDQVIEHLESLMHAVKEGRLNVQHEDQSLSLAPGENLKLEIKAGAKENKEKIEFELSWSENMELTDPVGQLNISSTEPEMESFSENPLQEGDASSRSPASSGPAIVAGDESSGEKDKS